MKSIEEEIKSIQSENRKLLDENEVLKTRLESIKQKKAETKKRNRVLLKKSAEFWAGSSLKDSFYNLYSELPDVSKSTLAEFSASLFKRFLRVGVFTIVIGLIPITILLFQTFLLKEQNEKIDFQNHQLGFQNDRIQEQVFLQEASRRNNLVLLMDNILNQVNFELNDSKNFKDSLSNPLIGRIKAISQGFQPYQFLDKNMFGEDFMSPPLSPERGQLLLALLNSKIDTTSMNSILKMSFSHSYLRGANLEHLKLDNTNLTFSDMRGANLSYSSFQNSWLGGTDLSMSGLIETNLYDASLNGANMRAANCSRANLGKVDLYRANLMNTNFTDANLSEAELIEANMLDTKLLNADLTGANLEGIKVREKDWIKKLAEWNVIGRDEILKNYSIGVPEKNELYVTYFVLTKKE